MSPFWFKDPQQWRDIAAHTEHLDHPLSSEDTNDRWLVEHMIDDFIDQRRKMGRGVVVPTRARDAWLKVAKAAKELQDAIAGLRAAHATDFAMLGDRLEEDHPFEVPANTAEKWDTPARHRSDGSVWYPRTWAGKLHIIIERAPENAACEMRRGTLPNNVDWTLDRLVIRLLMIWESCGGKPAAGDVPGPLARFLGAATLQALTAVGEPPLTPGQIRARVRSYVASKAPKKIPAHH